MATITSNNVYADPTQWWTLDYTFANSKFTWSVTVHASHTSYWNSIYGLTVNIGGNSYYKGDIDWRNYTPNTVVYSGTTNLSDCTISAGQVTLSVSGNFYYGTWNTDYRSYGSGTQAVANPTVSPLSYSATNKYSSSIVASRSVISFTMAGTSQSGGTITNYKLYQSGTLIYSGAATTASITAPAAGSYTFYYTATDSNGLTGTSGNVSITTYAYTPPTFSSVTSTRWSTGNSSGTASDTGTYARMTATFTAGKIGSTSLTTTCKATVSTYTSGSFNSGGVVWSGSILNVNTSYTVTYKLYDAYIGSSTPANTRTDTISVGGRGIDLYYDTTTTKYGVGVGTIAAAGYLDVQLEFRRYFNSALRTLLDSVYPVGSIYMSVNNTSPATFIGGTWTRINGSWLVGAGTSGNGQTYSAGTTYAQQLPNIKGQVNTIDMARFNFGNQNTAVSGALSLAGSRNGYTGAYGPEGGSRNILNFNANSSSNVYTDSGVVRPTSYCVYIWRRTA